MDRMSVARHLHPSSHETPARTVSVDTIARRYARVDAIVIEDHFSYQPPSTSVDADPGPMIVPGREWHTPVHPLGRRMDRHHIGILGVDALEERRFPIGRDDSPARKRRQIHLAGGAMVYNHPEYPFIDKMPSVKALAYELPLSEAKCFDAVELFNDVGFQGGDPANVLGWVERNFYARGLYPAMVGGQDDHGPDQIAPDPTYTQVMVTARTEDGLMAGIRAGRTYVSKSLDTQLTLRLDGRAVWDSSAKPRRGPHRLEASVANVPEGAVVELVRNGQVVTRTVAQQGSATLAVDLPRAKGKADYAYVRVWDTPGHLHTVGSAVPLR